jgi:protein-L-isoaspartate O-methyltransferase/anti-sigma regulatory factor (Ser/Thr protein kinase)
MFLERTRQRILFRVVAVITLICFISYDFAWAYPSSRPSVNTLAQQTLLTSDDTSDSIARATAKYLELVMSKDFRNMPLAGVQEMLDRIRKIASEQLDQPSIRVEGGAEEGQVFVRISDDCVLRYFNPRMTGLVLPDGITKVAWEKTINDYLSCQLLKKEEKEASPAPVKKKAKKLQRDVKTDTIDPIITRIQDVTGSGKKVMVLIDGNPGSGKTTIVARGIKDKISSCKVISIDNYVKPDRTINIPRLSRDLWTPHRKGVQVIVFEGLNLQYSLNELMKMNAGLGGYVYEDMQRSVVSVRARVEKEEDRIAFLRQSSHSRAVFEARTSIKQQKQYDLIAGYDYIFTRKAREGGADEDEDDTDLSAAPAVLPMSLVANISPWLLIPAFILTILLIDNVKVLVKIYRAKGRLSKYMAEEDAEKKKKLMFKWNIQPKEGRLSIVITRGVRVFTPRGFSKTGRTETLYLGRRMFFVYFPVRILLALKKKKVKAEREKQLTAMLEDTLLLSNMNFKDLVARVGATQGLSTKSVSTVMTHLRSACMEMCRVQDDGYNFIKVPQAKALDSLKVGSDKKRLGTVLLHKEPNDLLDLYKMLSALAASVNVLDPKPADAEELYLLLGAIRDFSDEDAKRERARLETEAKPLWERMIDEKLKQGIVRKPVQPANKPQAQPKRTLEPILIKPETEGPIIVRPTQQQPPQEFVDRRNNILQVFDAVMADDILSRNSFTVAEFMQARQSEFGMGTAVYMLELLGKMGVLCATTSRMKPPVYQLDDRFYTLPQDRIDIIRTVLYNLGDEIDPQSVSDTKTYIEKVLWDSKGSGPNPRNYAYGTVPFFPAELSGFTAFLTVGAAIIALLNLNLCVKIIKAKIFLKKYLLEKDPEERRKLEEKAGYNARYQGYNHFVSIARGVVVEVSKDANGKARTETVFFKFFAQLLYFPIIFLRGIGKAIVALVVGIPVKNAKLLMSIVTARKEWKKYLLLPEGDPRRVGLNHDIKKDSRGYYKHIAPGIHVYGWKAGKNRVKVDVRIRNLGVALWYSPVGLVIWIRQFAADTLARCKNNIGEKRASIANIMKERREAREKKAKNKRLRDELKKNELFNNPGMEIFLDKVNAYTFYADLVEKLGVVSVNIGLLLKDGDRTFTVTEHDGRVPWNTIELEKGLTVKKALDSGKEVNSLKVARLLHKKLNDMNFEYFEVEKMWEIYHILIMIKGLGARETDTPKQRKGRIDRIFPTTLLSILILLLLPFTAFAAPANLSYTYYSSSGYIETETYLDDWDGDTPADPSDDVPAGTVVHRIDEAFYDNGTPVNPSDDYGRPDRTTHPDGSYEEYEYYTGTDNIHYIRGYTSGGSPVFVYETISATFAIKTYTSGAGASYHLDSGNQYVNAERDTDGTIRTYEYDGSWNLTEMMVYHPDGRQDRHDYIQEVVEELTPGWKFYRGANLPWLKYGYDIGDGVNGETYEGLNTKRAQLLQQLNRFKGSAVRVFIFCDLRSGVTFDGGGTPTGLTTHVFDDMDALMEAAQVLGIRLIPVVFDYMMADNINMEGPNPVGEYPDLITDNAKRAALINVIRPFIQRYAGRPEIEMWDVLNEPIEITTSTPLTVAQVQTFITDFINMIHAEDSGSQVTIGAQSRQILLDNWTGLGQDIDQAHYYDYMVPWYPLTDDISTWGSGLASFGFFFGELEPTGVSGKLDDIYGSAVDGGGLFWQDTTGFTITDPQADTIRHWYDSAAQRPFPPQLVSVTDSNGSRTFTVTWQPYTGALAGSVTGYTINIGGETFYIAGSGTSSAVIDLPDHIYSGNHNLSIRTEVPDPQRDSDYSTPVTISAGQSPAEGRSGGSCSMGDGKMSPNSIFGTLVPYLLLVTVLLLLRHGHRIKREESEEEDSEMPESMAKKRKRRPASGNVLDGFNTVMVNKDFRESVFTSITFGPCRLNKDGNPFSYRTIKSELDGMVALGILNADRPSEPFEPIEFTLTERYRRAGKHLDSIRKVLKLLSPRPSEEELVWVKAKLDSQVFAEGEDLTYYYLRALPKMNLRLIRLGAERVTLEKELKQDPGNADKKEQLEKCQQRIQVLKTEITLEEELITPPDYELKRTGDRDYRAEAKDKMRRAIEMIEKKNEPAASALLRAAKQRFAEELLELSKTKVKLRGPRVWKDVEDKLHNVLRGQYISHGISADRDVLIKEWIPHRSETIWQGIRSCDREINNILRERDGVLSVGKRMKEYIDILAQRRRTLPAAKTGEPLPQPEVSDEEKEGMRVLLSEITESLKRAQVEEKVITHTAAESALELLDLGEYRSMLEEMMAARSLLRRRYFSLTKQIDKIRTGRLAILREYVRARNSKNIWKLDRILEMFEAGNRQKARDWMMGMTRDNDIKSEPEFHRMLPVLWQAINNIDTVGKENTVRRNIGIMKERVRSMVLLDSFMDGLREEYVDARLQGKAEAYYDKIFTEDFNQYLQFARDNNIGRGSPRLLWTTFYLAAYVSMHMLDPAKPSKKIDSPLFSAMLDVVRIIEADSIPDLTKAIEKKKKKYANVYEILLEYNLKGFASLDALSIVHWRRFLSALSKDTGLNEEQERELLKAAAVSHHAENLTDVARLGAYWREMWKEYIDTVGQQKVTGDMAERYRQLIGESLDPWKWPGIFEEDWEEGFVKENSALSTDDLAKRFLSHYPEINWFRKDLRKVTAFNGAESTMNDIYTNMLVGLTPGLPPETIKSTKERIWILREWIYRHWDGVPKERSYDVISRTAGMEDISGQLSQDEAVAHIGRYYDEGEGAGRVTGYKYTVGDGHFIASPAGHLKLLSEWLLDENKSVLDMGSGTGKAVAVFSRYAGHVTGVEKDIGLLAESEGCVVDLADVVDNGKIELYYGSLIDEDLSKYDLIYIFWPEYGEDKYRDYIKDRLQKKLLEELKPGAHFVIISATDIEKFSGLEEVEPPFTVPDVRRLTIYRKPEESLSSPAETEPETEEDPSGKDLGAEVSDISTFDRLESILNILRGKKGMAFSRDVVEAWLRYLDKRGLTEREFKDGTWIVTIKDETVDYIDKTTADEKLAVSIMRVARTVRRRVIKPEGGVSAINFKGSDGIWRIVGFQSELNEDVISHELKEVQERRLNPSMHWMEAHNRAVEETGVGVTLDTRMKGISRTGRGEDVGSLFKGMFGRSGRVSLEYLDIMNEHEKLDTQIKRLGKKKVIPLQGVELEEGKSILLGVLGCLKKEATQTRTEEIGFMDGLHSISAQLVALKEEMDGIETQIESLQKAGSETAQHSYTMSHTTMFTGEEAYRNMIAFLENAGTAQLSEFDLDAFLENVYKMAKCLEDLNAHAQTHALDSQELALLKNINVMMQWLFGARDDNKNAAVVRVSSMAIERQMKTATDTMHKFVQRKDVMGGAGYLDSTFVIKLRMVQQALESVANETGLSDELFRGSNVKMLISLWADYLRSFDKLRDTVIKALREKYTQKEVQHDKIFAKRESCDSGKTAAVEKRIFVQSIAEGLHTLLKDVGYMAREKGIFICDTGSGVFVTGQDAHIEIDTGNIYITKKAFERLLEVDSVNMSAVAARLIRLYGERKLLLENTVERCNIVIGFLHNKLRALRLELGEAGDDKAKVAEITGRMSELSEEILELEKEENKIATGDDPARILEWLRKRLKDTHEWVRNVGYLDWSDKYIEFTPNKRLLKQLLMNRKRMLEMEIAMVKSITHPSGYRNILLAGLSAELETTVDELKKESPVVYHIQDVNLGSLAYSAGEERASRPPRMVKKGEKDLRKVFTEKLVASGGYTAEDARKIIEFGIFRIIKGEMSKVVTQPRKVMDIYRQSLSEVLEKKIFLPEIETYGRFHEKMHEMITSDHARDIVRILKIKLGVGQFNELSRLYQSQHGQYESEEEFAEELAADYYTEKLLHNTVRLYDEQSGQRMDIGKFDENIPVYIAKALEDIEADIKNAWGLARNTMVIYRYKEHRRGKEKASLDMPELQSDLLSRMSSRRKDTISPYTPERFDYIFKRTIAEELGSERAAQRRSLFIFMIATEFSCRDMVAFLERAYPTEYRHLIDHMRRTGKADDDRILERKEIGPLLNVSGKKTYREQIVVDMNHLFRNGLNAAANGMLRTNAKHLVMHHKDLVDKGELRSFTRQLDEHAGDVEYLLTDITGNPKKLTVKIAHEVLEQMDIARENMEADTAELNRIIYQIKDRLKAQFIDDLERQSREGVSENGMTRRVAAFEDEMNKQLSPYYRTNEQVLKVLDSIKMIINMLFEEIDFDESISLEDVGGILRQLVISQELDFKYPRVAWVGGLDPRPISGEANICGAGSSNVIAFRVYFGSDFYPVTPDGDAKNRGFIKECLETRIKIRKYDSETRQFSEPEYFPMRYGGVGGINDHDYVFRGKFAPKEPGTYYVTAEVRVKAYKGKEFPEAVWRPSINPQYCTEDNPTGDIVFQVKEGDKRASYASSLMGLDGGVAIGIVLGALAVAAILHEVVRQIWIRQRVRGFSERHPVIDGFLKKICGKSYVPGFVSHIICVIFGTELGSLTLKDVLTHSKVPGSPDEAVGLIDRYYQTGEDTKTLTAAKATARGGIFTSSKTPEVALVAKAFLDKDKRALDLGSGTAKAVSVFSRYAGYVKGIEQDAALHAEGEACIRDLSDRMDMSNVELKEGDYFNEDFSQYDLVYIFWPIYHRNVEREMKRRLEDKLVRELKPGALFVVNNPMPGGPFSRLEMVDDARFEKTRMIVYRNRPQPEEISEDFDVGLSEDVFCDLEKSVEYGVIENTEELVAKVNEQSDIKAITLMGQNMKDEEHLNAQADELIAFQDSVTEWLGGMGLPVDEALELKQSLGEFALNIIEHSKEGIAENERDVFGVIACRARREDDKIFIEFFVKDNGIGCDLSGMMRQMKRIKDEGIFLPGGRGIFVAAIPLKNLNEDSLTLISLGKELMFNGIRDANGIPEGVVTSQPGTGSGTSVRMNLKRHIYEDAEEAFVESVEAEQPVETEKPRLNIEEIEARFIGAFREKQDISWTARGHKAHATVVYDEDFENFVVAPEASYREEHPELEVLDATAAQMFIGPEGSFGVIDVKFEIVEGKPAIVFDEIQASRGYREMTDSKVRERHRKWVESALRFMVNTAKDLGIEAFYASHKDRIERRYSNMKMSMRPINLWEHYEFPFKRKGWQSVVFDDTDYEWETLAEDEGGACFWELDEGEYEFTATDGPVYEELPSTDVMGRMEHVVPEMVNGLMTAGHGKKIVIAIDQELGSGWTRKQLRKTMNALSHLALGDDQLSDLLRNVVIRHGKADSLSNGLESLVNRGDVDKENIIIITNETNREAYFKGFEGTSTITGIDDEELTDGFYYPLVEIVLFTVARALKYDRENLIRCYRNISNSLELDDDAIWQRCWDPITETYKTTMVIKLIPGAVKLPGDRGLYRDIRQYIASRA